MSHPSITSSVSEKRAHLFILSDDYVTTDSGTGLGSSSPAFGEEDYRAKNENGIEAFVCPVGLDGRFTSEVMFELEGQHVKDADKQIITPSKTTDSYLGKKSFNIVIHTATGPDTPSYFTARSLLVCRGYKY